MYMNRQGLDLEYQAAYPNNNGAVYSNNHLGTRTIQNAGTIIIDKEESKAVLNQRLQAEYSDSNSAIDVRKLLVCGITGGLCGMLLAILLYATNRDVSKAIWGLFIGVLSGSALGIVLMIINMQANDKYRLAMEERRRQLRRLEQESIEKHDEFVYWDAGSQQGCLYRLFCCPHYGKITSERVIYSDYPSLKDVEHPTFWARITMFFFKFWWKKVESMDYDMVLDVSVEQSCQQVLTDTGTVILHCEASGDVSSIKDEQQKLIAAIESRDEKKLKISIQSSSNIKALNPLIEEARSVLDEVVEKRRADCTAQGIEFKPIFAADHDSSKNSSKIVHVRDVSRPYQVMDDVSYKITKQQKLSIRDEVARNVAGQSSAINPDIVDHTSRRL